MKLGEKIRVLRVNKGYSQEYMANRLEISQNAYSKIERHQTDLTIKRLRQIANVFEIQIIYFFYDD